VTHDTDVRAAYIICTLPRSGSWLLAEALNNSGLAGRPEEYFRPDHMHLWNERWGLDDRTPFSEFVRAAIDFGTTNGVFGAKLHWYQFEWFVDRLRESEGEATKRNAAELVADALHQPRYILLLRHDKPRQAVSYWRAERSNVWFVEKEGQESGHLDVAEGFPPLGDQDLARIRWLERLLVSHERDWLSYFGARGIRPLTVIYEHFVSDYEGTVDRILDWLGIDRPPTFELPPPGLARQADATSEWILARYLEARNAP
jgi:trehalose 2-sulfotransferase